MNEQKPYEIIFTLWLMVFAAASQIMIVAPILTRIAEELHVAESLLGTLLTVYAVAVGLFALVAGPISDRFGRRRILMAGSGMMAVALALHGLASSFTSLLVLRALAGAAGGILSGAAVAYVGDAFPIHRRGWANGWVMSGLAAGQIAGIPLGNVLADWMGFRAPFLAFAGVMCVAFFMILFRLPQPNVGRTEHLSVGSALRGYRELLRRREVRAAALAFTTMFMGLSLFVSYFPTWLEKSLLFTPAMVSVVYAGGGVANVLAGPRAGRLSDRIGRVPVIIAASIGAATMIPIITFVEPSFRWAIYPLFFVAMATIASRIGPMQALMTQLTEGSQRGTMMSLVTSIGQIGFGIGGALAGTIYVSFGIRGNAVIGSGSMLLMAFIVWRYLTPAERKSEESAAERELADLHALERTRIARGGAPPTLANASPEN